MASRLCPFCMQMAESDTCPHCGKNVNYAGSPAHLPAGYVVSGAHPYVLGAALGQGGFGITYIALNMDTGERVAIKEYYPTYCSTRSDASTVTAYSSQEEVYEKGKERFLDEARTLKSLSDLKSIVNILDFFQANNTAYLVMEFLEGSSLKEYAAKHGRFPAQPFLYQIKPLIEDLEKMHQRGVIHRDIAPDNIILQPDGQLKLIDFGAARSYIGDKSMTVVVKKGFAPVEQYFSTGSTASTDVYALAATIYYCITGKVPMDSAQRQNEKKALASPASLGADLSPRQEKALFKALEVQQKNRTESMQSLLNNLRIKPPEAPKPEKPKPEKPKNEPKPRALRKPPKEKPPKTEEKDPRPKKPTAIIAAAILVVISLFGFVLFSGSPEKTTEQLQSETSAAIPAEATAEEPATWERNVLMADASYDEDFSAFWDERGSASVEEIHSYFSSRPIFNTGIARSEITDVFFLDSLSTAPQKTYDVSASQDGTVLAWTEKNDKDALNLYIAGEGGINGEEACYALFCGYTALESVHFNGCFFTDTTQDMGSMFRYCAKLTSVDLSHIDTGRVTNMAHMFSWCEQVTALDLSSFDTAQVANMEYMFSRCTQLHKLDLSNFDTSSVTSMEGMFSQCRLIFSLDLSNFDTANVTDMSNMFDYMDQMLTIDISSFDTSRVTDMSCMFRHFGHSQFKDLDLSHFDTSNVTDMSSMFNGCSWLSDLDLSSFDTSKVENREDFMSYGKTVNGRPWQELFERNPSNAPSKPPSDPLAWQNNVLMPDTTLDKDYSKFWSGRNRASGTEIEEYFSSRPVFNTGIARGKITDVFFLDSVSAAPEKVYDVSAKRNKSVLAWTEENEKGALNLYIAGEGGVNGAEACRVLFYGYTALESVHFNNSFFTDTTTDMSRMFNLCTKLKTVDLRGLNTENVTNMSEMFRECDQLKTIYLDGLTTGNDADMTGMFSYCDGLTTLDLSGMDTSKVTNMSGMFSCSSNLTSLDLSTFDTSKVTNMQNMFNFCRQLTTLDLSSFDTSKVKSMYSMFTCCENLTDLDLRHFDTSQVTDMGSMFSYCEKLRTLNLSSFDTSQVTSMSSMFSHCLKLTSLDLSSFDTAQVVHMSYMFSGCQQLTTLNISSFDTSNLQYIGKMFYQCPRLTDLDLSHFDVSNIKDYEDFMDDGKTVNGRPWEELFDPNANNTPSPKSAAGSLAWQNNVLMTDASFDADHSKFWSGRNRATAEEMDDYFSRRPIFNTGIARSKVTDVFFLDSISTAPKKVYDISAKRNRSVLAWTEENEKGALNLYIAGEGGVNGAEACRVLFYGYTALESVHFNNSFFTDTATDMSYMFARCKSLKSLDMDGLNTENVTDMHCMFDVCTQLATLDLSGLDTSKVTNMGSMFSACMELKSLDLSNFDTARVTDMEYMFSGCRNLTSLVVSSFDTSNVYRMNNMFSYCTQLPDLDLSNFDTSSVTLYEDFMGDGKTVNGRPWEELFQ